MLKACLKHESWIIERVMEHESGTLEQASALHPNLSAWVEREYHWPALYIDEGGQG